MSEQGGGVSDDGDGVLESEPGGGVTPDSTIADSVSREATAGAELDLSKTVIVGSQKSLGVRMKKTKGGSVRFFFFFLCLGLGDATGGDGFGNRFEHSVATSVDALAAYVRM